MFVHFVAATAVAWSPAANNIDILWLVWSSLKLVLLWLKWRGPPSLPCFRLVSNQANVQANRRCEFRLSCLGSPTACHCISSVCPLNVSSQCVPSVRPLSMSFQCVISLCPPSVPFQSVLSMCPLSVSAQCALSVCPLSASHQDVLPVCPLSVSSQCVF